MAKRSGTIIGAEVTAATDQETFAYTDANFLRGGHHAYATLAERDAITPERRRLYAPVYVHATKTTYRLTGGLTNAHWVEDPASGGVTTVNGETGQVTTVRQFDVTTDGTGREFSVTHDLGRQNLQVSFADVTSAQHRPLFVFWDYAGNNAIKLMPDIVWPSGKIIRTFIS
jgi:hypothetical protein